MDRQPRIGSRANPEVSDATVASPELTERARNIMLRHTLQRLPGLVQHLHDALREELWQAVEAASSDYERAAITGDLGLFGQGENRQRLQKSMHHELLDLLAGRGRAADSPPGAAARNTPLELVETERFEVGLAVSSLGNALEQRLRESLPQLRDLARSAFPAHTVLPIEPGGVAAAVEHALSSLDLSLAAKTLCLSKAATVLAEELDGLYRDLVGAWSKAGLKPVRAPKTVSRRVAAPPRPRSAAGAGMQDATEAENGETIADLLSDLPWNEILAAPEGVGLKQRVMQLLSNAQGAKPRLDIQVDERIEVTDRMLSHMQDDPLLPPALKDLIRGLSMRLLVPALGDPDFFAHPSHPMLGMLDQLEHLAMLTPAGDELNSLLGDALATDMRDRQALGKLQHRVQSMADRRSEEFRHSAERMVAGYEGQERLRLAREEVRKRINRTLAGRQTHRAVQQLVEQGWRTLLELSCLRQGGPGPDEDAWWRALLAVHRYCGGELPQESGELPDRDAVKESLHEGLEFIGFDPIHRVSLLDSLEAAMEKVRLGGADSGDLIKFQEIPGPEVSVAPPQGVSAEAWEQALEQVDRLSVGSVLLLREGDREFGRHLLWRNSDGSELLFVAPGDQEARPLQRAELAWALQQGEARFLPPVDQGIASRAVQRTLEEMQERVGDDENPDTLTGLRTRHQLVARLTRLVSGDCENFTPSVLGFVRLDHFEAVTSNGGYQAGEQMLVEVARQLTVTLGTADCISYLGGRRYGFLAPVSGEAQAEALGEKIRRAVSGLPFRWNDKAYPVACSVGLAMVGTGDDDTDALLSAADAACYAAHGAGGDRVVLFRDGDETIVQHRSIVDGWLKAEGVVKSRRLRLRCQCIASTDPNQKGPHHHEILLSAYDEEGELLPLEELISAAETFNRMAEIDRLVLEEAFRWVHANPQAARELGGIAVNLSGQSLDDERLVEVIRNGLERFGIEPGMVSFEVTETAAIGNVDRAVAIIEGIHGLGCRFALDDFGTGMSSYSYLKRLPVDYLKIDGSFIKDLLRNPHDQAIVKSINEIAHFMGKETIAEYVESQEIRDCLLEMGVDYVQGYAVGRPRFLDELA